MLKCQKKWLELFLKKFLLCTFRNNVESETVLYLTNGRKKRAQPSYNKSCHYINGATNLVNKPKHFW